MRIILCVAAVLGWLCREGRAAEDNPIYTELLEKGVVIGGAPGVRLPPPTMADGLDAAAQQQAIAGIAGPNRPVEALLRNSVVAPFELRIVDDKSAGETSTARRVDLWFVAYGSLERIASEGFWKETLHNESKTDSSGPASEARLLTEEELRQRQIVPAVAGAKREQFGTASFTLFDRVRIHGTMRSLDTRGRESVLAAAVLDSRFAGDPQFPNVWRPLTRDEAGKLSEGDPQPYSGAGSYAKATQLKEPAGAVFVEYHLVFDEPAGWFSGANLLRSKLPILAQDSVRKFRRKLKEE